MDIKRKVQAKGSQGNAASDWQEDVVARAGNWQYGRTATANDIEDESQEENLAFGVPHSAMDFDPPQKASMTSGLGDMASKAVKTVVDKAKQVSQSYRSGVQESKSLGNELKETQRMYDIGRQALQQGQQQGK